MRQLLIGMVAVLLLSGCKTSGYNPLKIESEESWHPAVGIERLLKLLIEQR